MHFVERERLFVQLRLPADTGEFPGGDVRKAIVVSQGFALRGLALLAEMSTAGFAALEGVEREELGKLEVVGNAAGIFEALIQVVRAAGHRDALPELVAQFGNRLQRLAQARIGP